MHRPHEICLVQIARNEARCIGRSLESARAFVDRLVVIDTGSTDETASIARQLGAEVHSVPWEDDFSRARNRALEIARAAWVLSLDADEWIAPGQSPNLLREFIEQGSRVGLVSVQEAALKRDQTDAYVSWLARVFPGHLRYEGPIHEQLSHQLPLTALALVVNHDGYAPERRTEKRLRNIRLLQRAAASSPSDPYIHYQIGRQFDSEDLWNLAIESYERARRLGSDDFTYCQELDVRHLAAMVRAGQLDEALKRADQIRRKWPRSVDVYFTIGDLFMNKAASDPANAFKRWLPLAEAAWLTCLKLGERGDRGLTFVVGRGSHHAAHNLALVYGAMGNGALAHRYADLSHRLRDRFAQSHSDHQPSIPSKNSISVVQQAA